MLVAGLLLTAICGVLAYLGYLDEPYYYSEPFVFEPGKMRFEIDVFHECTAYEIGIRFSSQKDGYDGDRDIRRTFGGGMDINFPAKADLFLYDEHGQMVFSKTGFGGNTLNGGVTSGPDPIWFYAGWTGYLTRGRYMADIHIKQANVDFSHFDAEIFIHNNLKFSCQLGLMYGILGWYWLFAASSWL